jgi:DNA modification methylase
MPVRKATLIQGDVLAVLRAMPARSIHCVVTSPPYWGLRDYGIQSSVWGGDPACAHQWNERVPGVSKTGGTAASGLSSFGHGVDAAAIERKMAARAQGGRESAFCRCGAWRGTFGLEPTPQLYIEHAVSIFEEVRRVLRDDGTLWLNIGDCYAAKARGTDAGWDKCRLSNPGSLQKRQAAALRKTGERYRGEDAGLKAKDLVGMPWRLAFALQDAGWWLRRDIIWAKPNPMPESVTDRPTTAHEYVFLLAKSRRYFYDAEAVCERASFLQPNSPESIASPYGQGFTRRANPPCAGWADGEGEHRAAAHARAKGNARSFRGGGKYTRARSFDNGAIVERETHGNAPNETLTRNLRSVWTIATSPFPGAHFATFPPELARRCIAAGTSERGCCSECGAPWKRDLSIDYENPGNRSTNGPRSEERKYQEHGSAGYAQRLERRASTSGWTPTCAHVAEIAPCTVLDPFSGAGTTAMVALRMGRSAIGIELKPEYCEMARSRIERDAPLLNRVELATFSEPQCIRGGAAA